MASERFPKAYSANVKRDDQMMEYTTFDTMGIGARKSGLVKDPGKVKSLEHVGKSAEKNGGK